MFSEKLSYSNKETYLKSMAFRYGIFRWKTISLQYINGSIYNQYLEKDMTNVRGCWAFRFQMASLDKNQNINMESSGNDNISEFNLLHYKSYLL